MMSCGSCTVAYARAVAFPLFALVFAPIALAQGFHFGGKAGVPITQYFETGVAEAPTYRAEYSAATRRYTFGPSAEWRITRAFGFEVDALYHRMGYVAILDTFSTSQGASTRSAIDVKGNSWDFPLVAKYRFSGAVRPYLIGGGVLRHVGPVRGRGEVIVQNSMSATTSRTVLDTTQSSLERIDFACFRKSAIRDGRRTSRYKAGCSALSPIRSSSLSVYSFDRRSKHPDRPNPKEHNDRLIGSG